MQYCKIDTAIATAGSILVTRRRRVRRVGPAADRRASGATPDRSRPRTPRPAAAASKDATGAPLADDGQQGAVHPGRRLASSTPERDRTRRRGGFYVSSVINGVIAEFDARRRRSCATSSSRAAGDTLGEKPYATGTPLGHRRRPPGQPLLRRHRDHGHRRRRRPRRRHRHRAADPLRRRRAAGRPRPWTRRLAFPDGIGVLEPRSRPPLGPERSGRPASERPVDDNARSSSCPRWVVAWHPCAGVGGWRAELGAGARARRPARARGRRRSCCSTPGSAGLGGGFLGVSIFFTLSGFLITSLLLAERDRTGRHRARALLEPAGPPDPPRRARRARRDRDLRPDRRRRAPGGAPSRPTGSARWPRSRTGASCSATSRTRRCSPRRRRCSTSGRSRSRSSSTSCSRSSWWRVLASTQRRPQGARGRRRACSRVASAVARRVCCSHPGQDPSRVYYGTDTRAVELLVGRAARDRCSPAGTGSSAARSADRASRRVGAAALVGARRRLGRRRAERRRSSTAAAWRCTRCSSSTVIAAALVPGPVRAALAHRPAARARAHQLRRVPVPLADLPLARRRSAPGSTAPRSSAMRIGVTIAVARALLRTDRAADPPRPPHHRLAAGRSSRPPRPPPSPRCSSACPSATHGPKIVFSAVRQPRGRARRPAPSDDAPRRRRRPRRRRPPRPATGPAPAPGRGRSPPPPPPVRRILLVGDSVAQTLGRGLERWGPATRRHAS